MKRSVVAVILLSASVALALDGCGEGGPAGTSAAVDCAASPGAAGCLVDPPPCDSVFGGCIEGAPTADADPCLADPGAPGCGEKGPAVAQEVREITASREAFFVVGLGNQKPIRFHSKSKGLVWDIVFDGGVVPPGVRVDDNDLEVKDETKLTVGEYPFRVTAALANNPDAERTLDQVLRVVPRIWTLLQEDLRADEVADAIVSTERPTSAGGLKKNINVPLEPPTVEFSYMMGNPNTECSAELELLTDPNQNGCVPDNCGAKKYYPYFKIKLAGTCGAPQLIQHIDVKYDQQGTSQPISYSYTNAHLNQWLSPGEGLLFGPFDPTVGSNQAECKAVKTSGDEVSQTVDQTAAPLLALGDWPHLSQETIGGTGGDFLHKVLCPPNAAITGITLYRGYGVHAIKEVDCTDVNDIAAKKTNAKSIVDLRMGTYDGNMISLTQLAQNGGVVIGKSGP